MWFRAIVGIFCVWIHPVDAGVQEVMQVIQRHCVECHCPDGAGPFSLTTYRDVHKRSRQIMEVIREGLMPPWLPDNAPGIFAGERRVPQSDQDILNQWYSQLSEYIPSGLDEVEWSVPGKPFKRSPDASYTSEAYVLMPDGLDVYQNFLIPIDLDQQRYLEAVEIIPSNRRVTHHVLMKMDEKALLRHRIGDRKTLLSSDMTDVSASGHIIGWQPGRDFSPFPEGLSWPLKGAVDLALEAHLRPSGKSESVQFTVNLYFTDKPPTRLVQKFALGNLDFTIPAGEKAFVVRDRFRIPVAVRIYSILPHAHYVARTIRAEAVMPDGKRMNLIEIRHWQFDWQNLFTYRDPVELPAGTEIQVEFVYDNSADNLSNPFNPPRTIQYGPNTSDEMAEVWIQLVSLKESEAATLGEAIDRKLIHLLKKKFEREIADYPQNAVALDKLGRCLFFERRYEESLNYFGRALAVDSGNFLTHYYCGLIYRIKNQLDSAQYHFEESVKLNPKYYKNYGNLGTIFLGRRQYADARRAFEKALELNPEDSLAAGVLEKLHRAGY